MLHESRRRRVLRAARVVAVNLVLMVIISATLEGVASFYLLIKASRDVPPIAERSHTEYDPDLGWVNLPNVNLPHLYGPGLALRTNSQRLRADADYEIRIPADRVRIICSGDSFTLGYGVGNENTWCHWLTVLDPRLETLNMGQGGYGVGQAYLWYKRDGIVFEHDIHLFAFITADFNRMACDRFEGYGKPRLRLGDGQIEVTNTPVPKPAYLLPRVIPNLKYLEDLALTRLLRQIRGGKDKVAAPKDKRLITKPGCEMSDAEAMGITAALFADLHRINRAKQSELVLVHLPTPFDHRTRVSDRWRRVVRRQASRLGIHHYDLIEDLNALDNGEAKAIFSGHFSVEGNRFVAEQLLERLAGTTSVPSILDRRRGNLNGGGADAPGARRPRDAPFPF